MADVFVSYSREDKARAAQLVRLLEDNGWDVFWDQETRAGTMWPKVLEKELDAARCLLALWTTTSIESRWVRIEAYEALQGDKLLPLLLDDVRPPLEFRQTQTFDLTGWSGERADPRIAHLLSDLRALMAAPQVNLRPVDMIVQTISKPIPTVERLPSQSVKESASPRDDVKRRTIRPWAIGMAAIAALAIGISVAWRSPVESTIAPNGTAKSGPTPTPPTEPKVATAPEVQPGKSVGEAFGPPAPSPGSRPVQPKGTSSSSGATASPVKPSATAAISPRCIEIADKFQQTGQVTAAERDFLRSKECQK